MRFRKHTNNDARNQVKAGGPYWTLKAIAKRNGLRAESRLPESKALPKPHIAVKPGVVVRLKEGENSAAIGWQAAPRTAPAWFTAMVERNMKKNAKRSKYERQYARRAHQSGAGTP